MADTPQEFNSSPLKSYFPKRRGSSSEASFFRVNMQNFSGVTTTSTTLNGEFPPISLSLNVFFFPNAPHPTLCPPRNKKCESDVRSCRVCKTSVGWMASSVGGARKHNRWGVLLGKYITHIYIYRYMGFLERHGTWVRIHRFFLLELDIIETLHGDSFFNSSPLRIES